MAGRRVFTCRKPLVGRIAKEAGTLPSPINASPKCWITLTFLPSPLISLSFSATKRSPRRRGHSLASRGILPLAEMAGAHWPPTFCWPRWAWPTRHPHRRTSLRTTQHLVRHLATSQTLHLAYSNTDTPSYYHA